MPSKKWEGLSETREKVEAPYSQVKNSLLIVCHLADKSPAHTRLNKAPAQFRTLDYAEAHGYIRGVIKVSENCER